MYTNDIALEVYEKLIGAKLLVNENDLVVNNFVKDIFLTNQ